MASKSMEKHRFLYFYFNKFDAENVERVVPTHIEYWKTAKVKACVGGLFADHSGGLISFLAPNVEEAVAIIQHDPFLLENVIEQKWIKEWTLEMPVATLGDQLSQCSR